MGRLTEHFAGLQNRVGKSAGTAGRGATLRLPDLPRALQRITDIYGPKTANGIYRRAIATAGKILLAAARVRAAWRPRARRKRGQPGQYGQSGILPRSLAARVRTSRSNNTTYVVIGAARDKGVDVRRGRHTITEDPAKTVHLMERGFTASARVAGVRGRKGAEMMSHARNLARILKISRRRLSLRSVTESGFDHTLASHLEHSEAVRVGRFFAFYKAAKKTVVPGRHFLEAASRDATPAAVEAAKASMQADWAKLQTQQGNQTP
jgi:hypothetical protein